MAQHLVDKHSQLDDAWVQICPETEMERLQCLQLIDKAELEHAGTGKSHLIKAIHYETSHILSQACAHPDDITVILTAQQA